LGLCQRHLFEQLKSGSFSDIDVIRAAMSITRYLQGRSYDLVKQKTAEQKTAERDAELDKSADELETYMKGKLNGVSKYQIRKRFGWRHERVGTLLDLLVECGSAKPIKIGCRTRYYICAPNVDPLLE